MTPYRICQVKGCAEQISEERIRRVGAGRVKTCSHACSLLYDVQTQNERQRRSIERREREWKEKQREV